MVFSSLIFLFLFLTVTLLLYFNMHTINAKNNVLVAMSLFFYAWSGPAFLPLMLFSAFVNYGAGLLIGRKKKQYQKQPYMIAAIVIDLLLLGIFKYTGLVISTLNSLGFHIADPGIILPIGISFYTFQTMTYTIDVYRGEVKVQRSYRDFLLYVALFPQLIAGPIVRYSEIEPQLTDRKTTWRGAFYGFTRFSYGLGKKVLIANYCGSVARQMLDGELSQNTVLGTWLGIIMYTFQIYFDFAGYSDMAIGMGRIFGFTYSENFNLPYISKSITEFWRRWHISLSSFFRDYVYIPLGGNRKHQMVNLLVVWSLTGLWHGASWNFLLWGLYFFALLVVEKKNMDRIEKIPGIFRHILTLFLIVLGWALFYVPEGGVTDAARLGQMFGCLFGLYGKGFTDFTTGVQWRNNIFLLLLAALASSSIPSAFGNLIKNVCLKKNGPMSLKKTYVIALGVYDWVLITLSLISLVGASYNPFLYFRF